MIHVIPNELMPAIVLAIKQSPHPTRLAATLMLFAGLRLGEVHALNWNQLWPFDKPAHAIELTAENTKGNRARTLPVSPPLQDAIQHAHDKTFVTLFHNPSLSPMSTTCTSEPLVPRSTQRAVAYLGEKALNMRLTPHMLRHTFATRLLKVSDLETVRMALGHARINTTQVYIHTTTAELLNAMTKVSAAIPDLDAIDTQGARKIPDLRIAVKAKQNSA